MPSGMSEVSFRENLVIMIKREDEVKSCKNDLTIKYKNAMVRLE